MEYLHRRLVDEGKAFLLRCLSNHCFSINLQGDETERRSQYPYGKSETDCGIRLMADPF